MGFGRIVGTDYAGRRRSEGKIKEGEKAVDFAARRELAWMAAHGAQPVRGKGKAHLEQLASYNPANLLSACAADTGHERKGDFHGDDTAAAPQP